MENKKLFKKTDIILILVLLLIAAVIFFPVKSKGSPTAVIYADSQEYARIDLNSVKEKQTFKVNNVTIIADENGIYFEESNCKKRICIKSGILSKPGDSAACVTNNVAIHIEGKQDVDAIAY